MESYEYDSFRIVRPMDEGVKPTAATGFGRFEDVRGESGTRVTFLANQSAVEAGLLQEDRLRPILTKIFETSQYTIAFSSDPDANDIIGASATESQATESQTTADLEEAEPQEAPEDTSTGNGYHQAGLLSELLMILLFFVGHSSHSASNCKSHKTTNRWCTTAISQLREREGKVYSHKAELARTQVAAPH